MSDKAISVIIPTYNRAAILEKCLAALAVQTIDKGNFEVIVADDGSSDDTKIRAGAALGNCGIEVIYIHQDNVGANAARNRAIQASAGRILLFINDDTIAESNMLKEHLHSHDQHPEESVAVLGKVTISPALAPSIFSKLHLDASYNLIDGHNVLDWKSFYTCNVSVKKSFLIKYGIFEEGMSYHEDLELSQRLSVYGLKVIYNAEAMAYHHHLLKEDEYLGIARREGTSLSVWYKKSPHLKTELGRVGFYPGISLPGRLKYAVADMAINRFTIPVLLRLARFFSIRWEWPALAIYQKVFQSVKREAIRDELRKKA